MNDRKRGYPNGRCKARSKQAGRRCRNPAADGREVCRFHGSRSPGGLVKDGRYAKHAPERIAAAIHAAKQDQAATYSFEENLGVFDARIGELMERLDEGDSPEFRNEMGERLASLRSMVRELSKEPVVDPHDLGAIEKGLDDAVLACGASATRDNLWDTVLDLVERRSEMQGKAIEKMTKGRQAIVSRDLAVFVRMIQAAILYEATRDGTHEGRRMGGRIIGRIGRDVVGRILAGRSAGIRLGGGGDGGGEARDSTA